MAYGKEEEILLDYDSTATINAGNAVSTQPYVQASNPGSTNGTLGPNELSEYLANEFDAPLDPVTSAVQSLANRVLIIDANNDSRSWMYLSGRGDLNPFPPAKKNYQGEKRVYISPTGQGGILEAIDILSNPYPQEQPAETMGRALIAAAVPHVTDQLVMQYTAGLVNVTAPFHDRWIGHRFLASDVDRWFSKVKLGGHVRFTRPYAPNGAQVIEFDLPEVAISSSSWGLIPGGNLPGGMDVKPFLNYAIQSVATAGSAAEFDFTYNGASTAQVGDQYQNQDFDLTKSKTVVYVFTSFMTRVLTMSYSSTPVDLTTAHQHWAANYFRVTTDSPRQFHPANALPASDTDNMLMAGITNPTYGPPTPVQYRPMQSLGASLVLAGTRGMLAGVDDGTAVPAGYVGSLLRGVKFSGVTNLKVS